ncbi:SDR family oxidoreductase [Rhodococcus sovatensis]|uniref:SDR family oxidoreductase n=1 Tax=Rhodococcus sovatensis TaxID=1805840 RepID=A0ABZ2PIP9_9NOCA
MTQNVFDLSGKVVLVTGASGGLGRAHARMLADSGAVLVLTDLVESAVRVVAEELGSEHTAHAHDVTDPDAWRHVVEHAVAVHGRIDGLVNNAGICRPTPFLDADPTAFEAHMSVNFYGPMHGMQAVVPHMPSGGSVVNIASVAGLTGWPSSAAYSASKFAVRGMSRSAARDLAPHGVRVNGVCPGAVDTDMLSQESREGRGIVASLPIPRAARPEEISAVVAFLISDASSYSTGQDFVIDGGMRA